MGGCLHHAQLESKKLKVLLKFTRKKLLCWLPRAHNHYCQFINYCQYRLMKNNYPPQELERIAAELDAEALDMRRWVEEPRIEDERKNDWTLFASIHDKARDIVAVVNNCKKLEIDARTSSLEKTLEGIQASVSELRVDIYNLGDRKQLFALWLSYVIPRLGELEVQIRNSRAALLRDKLDCLHLMTHFEFETPL